MNEAPRPTDDVARWELLRNPFPPASEGIDYQILRQALRLREDYAFAPGAALESLSAPDRSRLADLFPRFLENANPIIRHIVMRTRQYLETTLDPETGEPYLKPRRRRSGDRPTTIFR